MMDIGDRNRAHAVSVRAWTKHIDLHHTYRDTLQYTGRIDKCRVCWIFKKKVHA